MKKQNLFIITVLSLLLSFSANAQDNRTIDTKVADLLVQMPTDNMQLKDKLMTEMESFGEEGLQKVCSGIVKPGTGDDTKSRFAIESYSRHLSLSGDEQLALQWESICLRNIESNSDSDVKSFFIQQLDYVGGEKTVAELAKYLTDEKLSAPAIKAMYMSGYGKATGLFADKLAGAKGEQLIGLINAIGNAGNVGVVSRLTELYPGADTQVKKAILAALSKLDSPASLQLLKKEASATGYNYEVTKATESLLKYARTIQSTNSKECESIAKTILKKSKTEIYRIDARLLLSDCYTGDEAVKVLVAGMKEQVKAHRGAVIEKAVRMKTPPALWLKELNKNKSPEVKKEILYLFAQLHDESLSGDVVTFFDNKDTGVRGEALMTYAILKKRKALEPTLRYMILHNTAADAEVTAKVLAITAGKEDATLLSDYYYQVIPEMKVVIVGAIGNKRVTDANELILKATTNENSDVAKAAIENLKYVVTGKDLDVLLEKYDNCGNAENKKNIGDAVIAATKHSSDKKAAESKVLKHINSKTNKADYISILAGLGGSDAVKAVSSLYQTGDKDVKEAALNALTGWSDNSALSELFNICVGDNPNSHKSKAFKSYVSQVKGGNIPDDQKLLLLRKIMPYAVSTGDKLMVIKSLGNVKTYLNFIYLKQYLDDNKLKNDVANSLFKVILPSNGENNGLTGKDVKETLSTVKELITGGDAQYFRIDIDNYIASLGDEEGYVSMFNGKDLSGWHGYVTNPIKIKELSAYKLKKLQEEADKKMHENWSVKDGTIAFSGKGANLCSIKDDYGDFEMVVDWRITKKGDSGIYLRGTPQVQIWDTSRVEVGAQVGSGGLYNNKKHESHPLVVADNPIGEWNTFRIKMVGERVTVYLNGILVVDNVVMDNYWDRSIPIFPKGTIELQAHGTDLAFRDIYVREIDATGFNLTKEEKAEGFVSLFNGVDLTGWVGNKVDYRAVNGEIKISGGNGSHGNLFTEKEYKDFVYRFEFKLTPGANNGLGIRAPLEGDAAYEGMELQILDNTAEVYANLKPYQYHGSVYGIIAAKRGYLKPVGEWNYEEVIVKGTHIKVILNGEVILDGDIAEASKNGTADHKNHPGLKREKGHIGYLGHGSEVYFRNIRIKEL